MPTASGMTSTSAGVRAGLVGAAAGVLSGLFGVGGGIVMVPLLAAWFVLDQRRASATSLLAIVPIAVASATGYAVNGNVDVNAGLLLLVGGVLGGQVGARLLPRTPIPTLQLWFGVLSVATAVRMVVDDHAGPSGTATGPLEGLRLLDVGLLVGVGLLAGVLAGLLGVGGGIVMVPGLVLLAGVDSATARGTSLLVVVVTALTATVTNLRNGLVEVRTALLAGLVGVPAGLLGATIGQWLPERVALTLFAVLLVWSGVRMLQRGWAGRHEHDAARSA